MVNPVVTSTPASPTRSPESWTEDSPKPLLYDLSPVLEWFPEDSSSFHADLVATGQSASSLFPSFLSTLPSHPQFQEHCPWQIAATPCTVEEKGVVAVLTKTRLELYQPNDAERKDWALLAHTEELPTEPFPAWRHLVWSTDGELLALCTTQGQVVVYTLAAERVITMAWSGRPTQTDPVRHCHVAPREPGRYLAHVATLRGRVALLELDLATSAEAPTCAVSARFDAAPWFPWISACAWLPTHTALLLTGPREDRAEPPFLVLFVRHSIQVHTQLNTLPPRPPRTGWAWLPWPRRTRTPLGPVVMHLALAPDHTRVLALRGDGTLAVHDAASLRTLDTYPRDVVAQWSGAAPCATVVWWSDTSLLFVNTRGEWHLFSYPNFHPLTARAESFAVPFRMALLAPNHALVLACRTQRHATKPRAPLPQQGFLTRTFTSLTNTLLWHFDDEAAAPAPRPAPPPDTHIQLWQWLPQLPETLLLRYLQDHEFETALALAHQYGLSTDVVYQTQWQTQLEKEPDSAAADDTDSVPTAELGAELLDQIQNKTWVLETCTQYLPRSMDLAFQLLEYGLALTLKLYDPNAAATYPFLQYRCQLWQLRQRYQVFECLLRENHVSMAALATFRTTNLIVSACHLAQAVNLDALALLFDTNPQLFRPFRCLILNHLPSFVDPLLYAHLLPDAAHPEPKQVEEALEDAKRIDFRMDVDVYSPIPDIAQWYADRAITMERETGNIQASLTFLQLGEERGAAGSFTTLLSALRMYAAFLYQLIPLHHPVSRQLDFVHFQTLHFEQKLHHLFEFFPESKVSPSLLADGILPLFQSNNDWLSMYVWLQTWSKSLPLSRLVAFLCAVQPSIPTDLFVEHSVEFLYTLSMDFTTELFHTVHPLVDLLLTAEPEPHELQRKLELLEAHTLALKILLDVGVPGMNYITLQSLDSLQFLHVWFSHLSNAHVSDVYVQFMELLEGPFLDPQHRSKYFSFVYTHLLCLEAFGEARLLAPQLPPHDVVQWTLDWMQPLLEQRAYATCLEGLAVLPLPAFEPHANRIRVLQLCQQAHLDPAPNASHLDLLRLAIPHVTETQARHMGQLLGFSTSVLDSEIAKWTCHSVRSMELCQRLMQHPDHTSAATTLLEVLELRKPPVSALRECLPFCLQHAPAAELGRLLALAPALEESVPYERSSKTLAPFFDPESSWSSIEAWLQTPTCISADPLTLFHGTSDLHTALLALPLCDPALVDVQFQALQLYAMVNALHDPSTPLPSSTLQGLAQLKAQGRCTPQLLQLVKEIEDLEHQSIQLILTQIPNLDLTRFLQSPEYQEHVLWTLLKEHQLDLAQRVLPYTSLHAKSTSYLLEQWLEAHACDTDFRIPSLVEGWCEMILQLESRDPVVQALVKLLENDSGKHNQAFFYRLLAKFDATEYTAHYLERADLVEQRIDANWSCQFLISQMLQGNRDYFAALFKTLFHHLDPIQAVPLAPATHAFFEHLAAVVPIPTVDRRLVGSTRIPFVTLRSVWVSSALARALKSRAPPENVFPMLVQALPLLEPMESSALFSTDLLSFLKKHCHTGFHTFYSPILPYLPLPLFQPIVDAVPIFQLLRCDWVKVSIFQYPFSAFLEHAVQQRTCAVDTLDLLRRAVTWDPTPIEASVVAALKGTSSSALNPLYTLWKSSVYEQYVWDRWAQLDVAPSALPEMDPVTRFKWQTRKAVPDIFRLSEVSLDQLHARWLEQHQDHEFRSYTVFQMRPMRLYPLLWKAELEWFQTQSWHWFFNILIQMEPPLEEPTEWAIFELLTSPLHIFIFCLCAQTPDLVEFAQAMLTPVPDDLDSTARGTSYYPLSHIDPFLQLHPRFTSSSNDIIADFYFRQALGLHPSLWSHWLAQRISWSPHKAQARAWSFELTQQELWAILVRRFQRRGN